MIESARVLLPGGGIPQLIYKSAGASTVLFNASGSGIILGGPGLNALNGFIPAGGSAPFTFANNEELWGMASSTTLVTLLIKT